MNRQRKHIHLGTRLEVAQSIRRNDLTAEEAARELGVPPSEVLGWVASGERPITFDEAIVSPDARRLTRRAQRLVALIAAADAAVRALTEQLIEATRAVHGAE